MPELPDVERSRRLVESHLTGLTIDGVDAVDAAVLRNSSATAMARSLRKHALLRPYRRGKWLVMPTTGPALLVHFGMTGALHWSQPSTPRDKYDRVIFTTADGELRYRDLRKLQGIWLATDHDDIERIIGPQGPDALGLSRLQLAARLSRRRGSIKASLMDQTVVAGLGNMLSDEVLWRARMWPARRANSLTPDEIAVLNRAMQSTLRASIKYGSIPRTRSWLSSQRDSASPVCPRCRSPLESTVVAGRRSLWCPVCQAVRDDVGS